MKINKLIEDLKEFKNLGKTDVIFFSDSEGDNVFLNPFYQVFTDDLLNVVVISPDETSHLGDISSISIEEIK